MRILLAVIMVFCFMPASAHAACTGPAGVEGKVIYNADHKFVQFCDGTDWVAMSGAGSVDDLGDHTATQDLDMASNKIINITDPTAAQDAASKAYVDAAAAAAGDDLGAGGSTTGNITMNNSSPTLYFQDTDHHTGMIHMNSHHMHFLSGSGVNGAGWAINGSQWPMIIDMRNDNISIGGTVFLNEGHLYLQNHRIINLGTPVSANDAATKAYVDANGGSSLLIDRIAAVRSVQAVTITATGNKWPNAIICNADYGETTVLYLRGYGHSSVPVMYSNQMNQFYAFNTNGSYRTRQSTAANCGASGSSINSICNSGRCVLK